MARMIRLVGAALITLVCVSCFSPWTGEEEVEETGGAGSGTVEIRIGAGEGRAAVMPYPPADRIGELAHKITLTRVEWDSVESYYADSVTSPFQDSIDIPAGTNPIYAKFDVAPGYYAIEVVGTWNGKPYSYFESDKTETTEVPGDDVVQVVAGQRADATATMGIHWEWPANGYIPITSAEDLRTLATQSDPANFPLDGDYLVVATEPIDLSAYNWKPIGDYSGGTAAMAFTGTFDGNNKTIRGLNINDPAGNTDWLGLFGYIAGGIVKNLTLADVSISAPDSRSVAGIAGSINGGEISNCVVSGTAKGRIYVGGVVGEKSGNCTIAHCRSSVSVTGVNAVGSVAGSNVGTGDNSTILYCSATGDVTGIDDPGNQLNAASAIGGVVGNNTGTIRYCFAIGNVTGDSYVGGVVGWNHDGGEVSDSYATGNVTGSADVGGVVGYNISSVVEKCYASGSVAIVPSVLIPLPTTSDYIGGVVGSNVDSNGGLGVRFCVALNSSFTMSPSPVPHFGRVVGMNSGSATSQYNYADTNMTTGAPWPTVGADNGADRAANEISDMNFWTGTDPDSQQLGWDPAVWNFDSLASGGLPRLAWELEERAP